MCSSSLELYRTPYSGPSTYQPKLADSYHPSSTSLGLGPVNRDWTAFPPISGSGSFPNYSQIFMQQMYSSSPITFQDRSSAASSLGIGSRDLSISLVSQGPKLREYAPLMVSPPMSSQSSSQSSFSLKDVCFSHHSTSRGLKALESSSSELDSFRRIMAREECFSSPHCALWTIEHRAFQAFQGMFRANDPIASTSVARSFSQTSTFAGSPLTADIMPVAPTRSSEVSSISSTRIVLIDSAVGFWNGTKQALAQIGLEQMDMSSQERLEILGTMAIARQTSRTALKERLLASAAASKSFRFKPSEWFEVREDKKSLSSNGSRDSVYDFETMIQVNMLLPNLSRPYDLGRPELLRGGIGFVNGIMNSDSEARASSELISFYAGNVNMHSVYNASTGFVSDNMKVVFGMKDPSMTRAVLALHKTWNDFFAKAGPRDHFLQFCHSGGATQCKLALESYSPELRKRIEVAAISPATYISGKLCHSVVHYVSTRDFVPKIDRRGMAEMNSTIIWLTPHPDVPLWAKILYLNHGISSPTFQDVIKERMIDFISGAERW